jgi:hypothetical protein
MSSYGYFYTFASPGEAVLPFSDFPLLSDGPRKGFIHALGVDAITITETGVYEIYYAINYTTVGPILAVAVNGTSDSSTFIELAGSNGYARGTAILNLIAGDVVSLKNESPIPVNLSMSPAVSVQLIIKKIG